MECDITFVLLGKPGSGKSRTGNTVTGCDKAFVFGWHASGTSTKCELASTDICEQGVCVIDTPGVSKFEKKEYEDVRAFILKNGVGKIIFLLCVSVGRLTQEERLLIDQYFSLFGDSFAENTIIIFTHLDEWKADMQDRGVDNVSFDSYLKTLPKETKLIIERFHGRYLTVNNKQEKKGKILWRKELMDIANSVEGFTRIRNVTTTSNTSLYQTVVNTSSMASRQIEEKRECIVTFVILGKTGSGKSRTGNTITDCNNAFVFGGHASIETKMCKSKTIELFEQSVCVIDTPGVSKFDKKEYEDVRAFISKVGTGKIIFLLCVSVGRFTQEERLLVDQYFYFFGEAFAENTIIVFTHLDEWEADMKNVDVGNVTFDSCLRNIPEETNRIIERFHSRYLTVNNKQEKRQKMHWRKRLMDMTDSVTGFIMLSDKTTSIKTSMLLSVTNTSSMASMKNEEKMEHVITFVLLGKAGSGKSRTGNTITDCNNAFEFGGTSYDSPKKCESRPTEINNRSVCVIDTPGVSKLGKKEYEDVRAFISKDGTGKIIFLLCVSVGRFTQEELLLIDQYFNLFGEAFAENTIIIFTHLDEWEADMQDRGVDVTFESYMQSLPEETTRTIERFHGRYLAVNNKQGKKEKMHWRKSLIDMTNAIDEFTIQSIDTTKGNMPRKKSERNTCLLQ